MRSTHLARHFGTVGRATQSDGRKRSVDGLCRVRVTRRAERQRDVLGEVERIKQHAFLEEEAESLRLWHRLVPFSLNGSTWQGRQPCKCIARQRFACAGSTAQPQHLPRLEAEGDIGVQERALVGATGHFYGDERRHAFLLTHRRRTGKAKSLENPSARGERVSNGCHRRAARKRLWRVQSDDATTAARTPLLCLPPGAKQAKTPACQKGG